MAQSHELVRTSSRLRDEYGSFTAVGWTCVRCGFLAEGDWSAPFDPDDGEPTCDEQVARSVLSS